MTHTDPTYPDVEINEEACGMFVLVQMAKVATKTKGGIILTDESRDTDQYMSNIGVIRSIGSVAFRYRTNGEKWPGKWPHIGDRVRVPEYGGIKFHTDRHNPENDVVLALFKDNEIISILSKKD